MHYSTYEEAIDYLYNATPQFQSIGAAAYKPGLETAHKLDILFGRPHRHYDTIHVAGTNGKGSTSHTLAAVLQSAGYKVGLYTSPHLVDFRERIRVNGKMIPHEAVIDFINRYLNVGDTDLSPSFFELTTIMAFDWFAKSNVDVAIIETGLGGRLDTTNIITPVLSIITNISLDHVAQLGDNTVSIAHEKAGIIKPGIPVVIGEWTDSTLPVFQNKANECKSQIILSNPLVTEFKDDCNIYPDTKWGDIKGILSGECQSRNASTVLTALKALECRFDFSADDVKHGFLKVTDMTGLMGRWTILRRDPLLITDTGHNTGGWEYLSRRVATLPRPLTMVIGFVNDKDVSHILPMMPTDAQYIFTQASIPRAMEAARVSALASRAGLHGVVIPDVGKAMEEAIALTPSTGSVFVGGSTFVVADLLRSM